ncbi:MAG: hypothetical protein Q7T36_05360 [Fluviicoccus sp.]|uniref:hypothetical protein n=1 Tax=Fluviicoccus sp. TaxID=2003552 RepID=UPI00272441D7|nr:hypothetical protein [Fluviicoccus sp.]MDO8329883.1 hypothetical protein [Fluviicoccus sp.]
MIVHIGVKDKKKITHDWGNYFPSLEIWKPMWLVRRHGPILYGICLDIGGSPDVYVPKVFMHCLAEAFPAISLNGSAPVLSARGQPSQIKLKNHESEYDELAQKFRREFPPLMEPVLSLESVIEHFSKYTSGGYGIIVPFQHGPYLACALSAAAVGRKDIALSILDKADSDMKNWPSRAFNIIGDKEKWLRDVIARIDDPESLLVEVSSEVAKHGLTSIKSYQLL